MSRDGIFYGSDAPTTPEGTGPAVRWGRLRHRLPLTNEELEVIATNGAPYLFWCSATVIHQLGDRVASNGLGVFSG